MPHVCTGKALKSCIHAIRCGIITDTTLWTLCRYRHKTHWSGAKNLLDRGKNNKFGDAAYAFEELVAELGAAFLCGATGVESVPREDHSQYIQNWLKALKSDKKFIFSASSQAQKAVDYLFSFQEQAEAA
ncbi:MAG: antirestriction protein [Alphaproteobacteria bacterium CG_4_9_14_3_um_filter_47_13]|nr:MAG: antirestriction protein [Alphaproteobacteria bacterium CG_4_9_14_3_um_filter_47_13]